MCTINKHHTSEFVYCYALDKTATTRMIVVEDIGHVNFWHADKTDSRGYTNAVGSRAAAAGSSTDECSLMIESSRRLKCMPFDQIGYPISPPSMAAVRRNLRKF